MLLVLASCVSCVRPAALPKPATPAEAAALRGALAAREQMSRGLRISMSVRISGGEAPSVFSTPAYLAVDEGSLRLQVLSPFGMTVMTLAITGNDYELVLPLRNETKRGRVDVAASTSGPVASGDRMIVALALLFTPKMGPECRVESTRSMRCPLPGGVTAEITVDDARRPIRERYTGPSGDVLFTAAYADYPSREALVAGRLEIVDGAGGGRMTARITKARTATAAAR